MIKVLWLKAHHKFAYSKGNIGYVTPEWAEKLLEGGYITIVPETDKEAIKPAPIPAAEAAGDAAPAPIPPAGADNKPADIKDPRVNPLPEDLPGREKLFESGFKNLKEVEEAGDGLLDVVGISNAMLKKITKYLKGTR